MKSIDVNRVKGALKGKVSYSIGLMTAFLITGTISVSQNLIQKSDDTEVLIFMNTSFLKLQNRSISDIAKFTLGNDEIVPPVTPEEPPVTPEIDNPVIDIDDAGLLPMPEVDYNDEEADLDGYLPTPELPQETVTINTQDIVLNSIGETGEIAALTAGVGEEVLNKAEILVESDIGLLGDRNYDKVVAGAIVDGGVFTNDVDGKISVVGVNPDGRGEGFGIYQKDGTSVNNGTITVQGNGHDIDGDGISEIPGGVAIFAHKGTVINNGVIESQNWAGAGMVTTGGAYLENNGLISNMLVGMWAINEGSIALNNGKIKTEYQAMTAGNGGTVINDGLIEAWDTVNDAPAIAMSAISYSGDPTLALNTKNGVLYGVASVTGGAATFRNEGILHGDVLISMGGIVENNGTITGVDTDPNTVTISDGGRFIQSIYGKLSVGKFEGDIHLSGDYTKNNFNDTVEISKENIEIKDHNGNILSNSVMYTVNQEGTELQRKGFDTILENSSFASYLENNYVDGNILRQELFNNLKLIGDEAEFTRASNNIFGNDIYPNMKKQTLEAIRFNKSTLEANLFNQDTNRDLRVIGGADYKHIKTENSNLSGYKEDIKSVFLGADKKINSNLRAGIVANIGTLEAKYNYDKAKREDTFGQLNVYSIYKNDGLQLVNNLYAGLSSGDVERDLAFGDVYGRQKGDLNSKWVGLNNTLSKKVDLNSIYVKPKVELNATYLMQDAVSENGDYGLDIEKQNVYSVEAGVGLEVGKEFRVNNLEGAIKLSGSYLRELADPYSEMNAKLNNISSDTVKLSSYDKDSVKEVGVRLELGKNGLKGYGEYKYLFNSESVMSVGAIYKF